MSPGASARHDARNPLEAAIVNMIGTCKLCRRNEVELMDSHLLPANIYKKIRRSEGANNSVVVATSESFRFTDKQISDYVLCCDCEQRVGEVEEWMSRQCLQDDGSFPMRDTVVAQPALGDDPEVVVVSGRAAQIDAGRYVYFASSILWRAGVHEWSIGSDRITVELGPYEEPLRLYRSDRRPFPRTL